MINNLLGNLKLCFKNVIRDNMDHMKSMIAQAFVINDRFHLIKWKVNQYNGAFEVIDTKRKKCEPFLSTNLDAIIKQIKQWEEKYE